MDAIVDATRLPLSIIIVGVGNADFENMEILDGLYMLLAYSKLTWQFLFASVLDFINSG